MAAAPARPGQIHRPDWLPPIIRTKLLPPQAQRSWVARPRLLEQLDDSRHYPLTLISAPAGFGKTTLLSAWVHLTRNPAVRANGSGGPSHGRPRGEEAPWQWAWVSLNERDSEPGRFAAYLLAAIETLGIDTSEIDLESISSPESVENAVAPLINLISLHPRPFSLVLDDYHLIASPRIHEILVFLLDFLPAQMHLVIASRVDPPLTLPQRRARGQLLELRATDLRFTVEETKTFLFETMELDLSEGAAASLESRTEGWIAGLQLAALALKSALQKAPSNSRHLELPRLVDTFSGNHRYIGDYLAEQVLFQQSEPIQTFLLETSILDRFSAPLCDAIIEEGERMKAEGKTVSSTIILHPSAFILDELERANLFLVPLDGEKGWYRYHPLFAEFLRERLRRGQPDRWLELHQRAAEWYERNGLIPEAVDHALAVGEHQLVARLIERIAETIWMSGEMVRLLGWIEALPEEIVVSRPQLCLYHAWILNILGNYENTEKRLSQAENNLEEELYHTDPQMNGRLPPPEWKLLKGMCASTRAILLIMQGDIERAVHLSDQALQLLPEDNRVWRSVTLRNLGMAYLLSGQTQEAVRTIEQAFELSQEAGSLYMSLVCLYELGEIGLVQGRLQQAAALFREAIRLSEQYGIPGQTIIGAPYVGLSEALRQWNKVNEGIAAARTGIEIGQRGKSLGVQVCGYTRLGMLLQARGDQEAARQAFQQAAALAPTRRRTSFVAHHDVQAQLWSRLGDSQAASQWARAIGLDEEDDLSYLNETAHIEFARSLIAQGRLGDAGRLLDRLETESTGAGRIGRLIEIHILQARAFQAAGDQGAALAAILQALSLAEPEGAVRVFADEGPELLQLVKIAGEMTPESRLAIYARKLAGTFESPASAQGKEARPLSQAAPAPLTDLVESLSQREQEILRLIARGLSNDEIARSLFLAVSTVHWHVKNLYGKLGVHSRTQAVLRAGELGLLA